MANKNTNLHKAKREKDDEFYTTYETVASEMSHYTGHFEGKTVLCNCDDPFSSNFCRYFVDNFNSLKLHRLICTSYSGGKVDVQPTLFDFDLQQNNIAQDDNKGLVLDIDAVDDSDVASVYSHINTLDGDGDFRSEECLSYLSECDIVVTNPPFSLFKEFVATVLSYGKKFLIIGNQNALTYKEIFPLIQSNQVWTGFQFGEMKFMVPESSEPRSTRYWVDSTGQKWRSLGNAMWLTNLDNSRRHKRMLLTHRLDEEIHKRYDNYNAIHVRNITEIPSDYSGIMAVPITFFGKYNSEQFELIGEANHGSDSRFDIFKPILDGKEKFKRILIRNRMAVV